MFSNKIWKKINLLALKTHWLSQQFLHNSKLAAGTNHRWKPRAHSLYYHRVSQDYTHRSNTSVYNFLSLSSFSSLFPFPPPCARADSSTQQNWRMRLTRLFYTTLLIGILQVSGVISFNFRLTMFWHVWQTAIRCAFLPPSKGLFYNLCKTTKRCDFTHVSFSHKKKHDLSTNGYATRNSAITVLTHDAAIMAANGARLSHEPSSPCLRASGLVRDVDSRV